MPCHRSACLTRKPTRVLSRPLRTCFTATRTQPATIVLRDNWVAFRLADGLDPLMSIHFRVYLTTADAWIEDGVDVTAVAADDGSGAYFPLPLNTSREGTLLIEASPPAQPPGPAPPGRAPGRAARTLALAGRAGAAPPLVRAECEASSLR